MRRLFLVGLLLLPGCRSVVGPFEHRSPQRVDDPLLSVPEQEQRKRDRLALPEQSAAGAIPIDVQGPKSSPPTSTGMGETGF
jgi:hypothetical protein